MTLLKNTTVSNLDPRVFQLAVTAETGASAAGSGAASPDCMKFTVWSRMGARGLGATGAFIAVLMQVIVVLLW